MPITTLLHGLVRRTPLPLALLLAGCQGTGASTQVGEKLNQILDNQGHILAKIDTLDAAVATLPAPVAAAPSARDARANKKPQPDKPNPAATYSVPIGDAHVKGSPEALVTIVEWSDFQCPYCSRVTPTMKQLTDEYGDTIRVAFKHNPLRFHPRAMPAALAAEAAGRQGKFWEMHDMLFENQKQLTDENFVAWAGELGLDIAQFSRDLKDPTLEKKATAHQQQGMTLGARGTPAFFINGRFLSGAQPVAAFKALIDEEMKKASALVAAGTPKARVYDEVIKNGKARV